MNVTTYAHSYVKLKSKQVLITIQHKQKYILHKWHAHQIVRGATFIIPKLLSMRPKPVDVNMNQWIMNMRDALDDRCQ